MKKGEKAMETEEKRAIRAAALLEFEEAKADLALLRAKAAQHAALVHPVYRLLLRISNESTMSADSLRSDVLNRCSQIQSALDLEAILSLDAELKAAVDRLNQADTAKKSLGFS